MILPKKSLYLFVILCGFAGIMSGCAGTDVSQTRVLGKKLPPNATNGQVKGILVNALNGQPLPKIALGLLLIPEVSASSVKGFAQTGPKSYHALIGDRYVMLETQMKTQTDSLGGFLFRNVPAGTYVILPVPSVVDAMSYSSQGVIKERLAVPFELRSGQVLNLGTVGVTDRR